MGAEQPAETEDAKNLVDIFIVKGVKGVRDGDKELDSLLAVLDKAYESLLANIEYQYH